MTKVSLLVTLTLAAAVSGAAAAEISSDPIPGQASGVLCTCSVTNTSATKTIDVDVDILNGNGSIADSAQYSIPPLGTANNLDSACGFSNPHWCRVSGRFPKKKVRAIYCVSDDNDITKAVCSSLR